MPTHGKDASMAQRGWKMQSRDQQPRLLGMVTSELAKSKEVTHSRNSKKEN